MTFPAACCVLALAAAVSGEPQGFEELPFAFRLDPSDAEHYRYPGPAQRAAGTSIRFQIEGAASDVRIDVFDAAESSWPRWRWRAAQAIRGSRAEVAGSPGVETLIVVRRLFRKEYQIDGPFRWPESDGQRSVSEARFRSLSGADADLKGGGELALIGRPEVQDPLCENDKVSGWQCVAVPASFKGVATLCGGRVGAAFAEISPGPAAEVVFRHPAWASAVKLTPVEPLTEGENKAELNLVKPGPGSGQFFLKEAGFEYVDLGANLFWLHGASPASDQVLQAKAGKYVTRLPLLEFLAEASCGRPQTIALELEQRIFGTVQDGDGKPAPRPFVFVLEETAPKGPRRVVSGVDGDDAGRYAFSELLSRSYIVRACQGSLGCLEKSVVPGTEPVDFRLQSRGVFKGRIVSTSSVPEPGATVRILPTISTYGAAKDRSKYLPMETRADGEGRFQVAAPDIGRFLVEARTNDSGTARLEVEVTDLSAAETDLGDIHLPPLAQFSADLAGCGGGTLELTGPVGGATSLPSTLNFPIELTGRAIVGLPEGGIWMFSATCAGVRRTLDPAIVYKAEDLVGLHVRFNLLPIAPAEKAP